MTSVFIGGSRKISRLNPEIQQRIDCIIDKSFKILVGDANGADKAVQAYLHKKLYGSVEVFCTGGNCRNNIGHWQTREVEASGKKGFDFYAAKDQVMADEASYGLMIWDGKSTGTLMNVHRLIEKDKKAVIYVSPSKSFVGIKSEQDWDVFLQKCSDEIKAKIKTTSFSEEYVRSRPIQMALL